MKQLLVINRITETESTGNITGWDEAKTKVFIPKHLVTDAIRDLLNEDGKASNIELYVCADDFSYQRRDDDGELEFDADKNPVMFSRLEAVAVGQDFADAAKVMYSKEILAEKGKVFVEQSVKQFKLDKSAVDKLIGKAVGTI